MSKGRRVRAWNWKDGQKYVRFSPNPGFNLGGKMQWSRYGGWRGRKREAR